MKAQEPPVKKHDDNIIEGEVIAEFRDDTLMNLPSLEKDRQESISTPKIAENTEDNSRRQLIVRLLMGGAAALALGGSAALLLNREDKPGVVVLPNGAQVSGENSVNVAQLVKQIADLQQSLESVTIERDQVKAQFAELTTQWQAIKPQLELAQALNDLWKSLDDIGLDDLLNAALSTLTTVFGGVMGVVGLLQTGITEGQSALDYVSTNFPRPQSGIQWLSSQIALLSKSLNDLAAQVQQAVEPVQPYAQMIGNFVVWVLDQLPFNIGAKARAGLEGMQGIIAGLPALVEGISNDVLEPLAIWFGSDPLRNLSGILLDPIKAKVIDPTRDLLTKVLNFNDSFEKLLITPCNDALARRAGIRAQINSLEGQNPG